MHLDLVTPAYFRRGPIPKPTHTRTQIHRLLSRFAGHKLQLRAEGVFFFPFEKLPRASLIRAMSFESKTRGMSLKLTAGTFAISGVSVQRMSWSLEEGGKEVQVRLRAMRNAIVNEKYLVEAFKGLQEDLQVFVLGHESTARHP